MEVDGQGEGIRFFGMFRRRGEGGSPGPAANHASPGVFDTYIQGDGSGGRKRTWK